MDLTPNDRLKLYRVEELNMSQKDMARALDMQQGSYSDIERGRVGVNGILTKLIKNFSINPIWLIEGFGRKKLEDAHALFDETELSKELEEKAENLAQDEVFQLLDKLEQCQEHDKKAEIISQLKSVIGQLLIDNNRKLNEINELKGIVIDLYKKRENLKNIIKKF